MTEDEIIAALFAPLAGPGGFGLRDDAAVLSPTPDEEIVTTVDALVAGVHFFADDPPASIALKALAVNLSDLAAKGAVPTGFLLALALPPDWTADWLRAFAGGLGVAAGHHGCPLLGGDTVRTPGPLTVSITAFGAVRRGGMVPRTGLKDGDRVYVTGTIGDAALGLALRSAAPGSLGAALEPLAEPDKAALRDRYLHPRPRLGLVSALRAHATAGMDVSDGLVGDLRKMFAASGIGGRVTLDATPLSRAARSAIAADARAWATVVTGGDDYELLVGVAVSAAAAFEAAAAKAGIKVTTIAEADGARSDVVMLDARGAPTAFHAESFQHF